MIKQVESSRIGLDPLSIVAIAAVLTLYIIVALCAMYAWDERLWLLAIPLTIIFIVATIAVVWYLTTFGGI